MAALDTPWSERPWRRVLVYGLGLSGRAAARLLLDRGVEVVAVDARPAEALPITDLLADGLFLLHGGEGADLPVGLDGVVLSPGVSPDRPLVAAARDADLPVIAEVELAFPFLDGPLVGITGSNGKSTTTALTGELLRAAGHTVEVCGNIGIPLSACVPRPGEATRPSRTFVVELSSFQLEAIRTFRARAGALLNVSPDHLDRYPSLTEYAEAKRNLFYTQQADDVAVLNADDDVALVTEVPSRRRHFSRRHLPADGCGLVGDSVVERDPSGDTLLFHRSDLVALEGVHNLENAMAAALLARALGASPAAIQSGLRSFQPLPHRLTAVGTHDGVTWYDDSKGTNVAAVAASLEGFPDASVHLILGGRNKGADFRYLRDSVSRKAARLYLIGESAADLADALGDLVPAEAVGTLDAAVDRAAELALPEQFVLLSPACASFDQFRDYHHRGETFRQLVRTRVLTHPADEEGGA
jgi:UDP-N-acetylmuramoylalanine--D-glutamate ligase